MDPQGYSISNKTFYCHLQRCINKKDLAGGRALHRLILRHRSKLDAFLGSHLIRMFASFGSLMEASEVFSKLTELNVFTWNAIISAHVKFGYNNQAINLYHQMLQSGLKPDGYVHVAVLKACASAGTLPVGRLIHEDIVNSQLKSDIVVDNALIDMYSKCWSLQEARSVFDIVQVRNPVTWNAMISGYVQHGHCQEAIQLFQQMLQEGVEPNDITFASILKECADSAALSEGKLIHFFITERGYESDAFIGSSLIDMYSKCGCLQNAIEVFDKSPSRTVVTWTTMIAGYAQFGQSREAFLLFQKMRQDGLEPNGITIVSILKACSGSAGLDQVRLIHRDILERGFDSDVHVGSALVDTYAKCESIGDAHSIFERLAERNVVTWSAMIEGLSYGYALKALQVFCQMQSKGIEPDTATFVSILKACSSIEALEQAKCIHVDIIRSGLELDAFVGTTLIDMYAKCGSINDACRVFEKLHKCDEVIWSTMIAGYAVHGLSEEAITLFYQMQEEGLEPDIITFVSIMKACANIVSLVQGMLIHAHILKRKLDSDVSVANTVIDMYARYGSMEDASSVFEALQKPDGVTWSTMISGYAQHSSYELALKYFEDMQREGWKPDDVTYVSVLSACSSLGLVGEGCLQFESMKEQNIAPTVDHYNCMVDLLGRAGCLEASEDLLQSMPFVCNIAGWTSLLGHCKRHRNVKMGQLCFDHVVAMDQRKAAGYVLMSNIYVQAGKQEDADRVEELRAFANAWKKPGQALIEVCDDVHNFIVSDSYCWRSHDIDAKLQALGVQMKEEGYTPNLDSVPQSMAYGDKEVSMGGNPEKMGIKYGCS